MKCKYKNKCPHYSGESYTCNYADEKDYCGQYRGYEELNNKEKKE